MVDELLKSNTIHQVTDKAHKYFKWLIVGVVTMFILGVVVIGMVIIGLFNLLISPMLSGGASLPQQGQVLMTEGQKWFEAQFAQEQRQLQDIQRQLNDVTQNLQQHTDSQNQDSQENQEGTN